MGAVYLTDRFFIDLQDIYDHSVKKWGEATAEKYLDAIQNSLLSLEENPELLLRKHQISKRLKLYPSGRHWLICDTVGDDIYALTIKHMSLNLVERLEVLQPTLEAEVKVLYDRLKRKGRP
ncbi:type II toxin-antitoxin system RelE/ParE family toxin [Roseivirga pacifica]|uniref:type II toxin-antitoxin system RelE/ParE family toxin n=1 Tax=Roseivirga pacifica TaxID=1267423 RepID=UPI00227BD788